MTERRVSEKKIATAIAEVREIAEKNLKGGGELECFAKGILSACFNLENGLEMAHPAAWGKVIKFEVTRELYLPGRFVKYAILERKLDAGVIAKEYQNGDVRLAANADQLAVLRASALTVVDPTLEESVDRGIKTAARAVVKQLDKVGA